MLGNFKSNDVYNNLSNNKSPVSFRFKILKDTPEKRLKSSNLTNKNSPIHFKYHIKPKLNNLHNKDNLKTNINNIEINEIKLLDKDSFRLSNSKNDHQEFNSINTRLSRFENSSNNKNPLKPLKINKEEKLNLIIIKKDKLKKKNYSLINNFLKNILNIKENIISSSNFNFNERIKNIWNCYIEEQKNIKNNKNITKEIKPIKDVFKKLLKQKINFSLERKKKKLWIELINLINIIISKNINWNYIDDDLFNNYKNLLQENIKLEKKLYRLNNEFENEYKEKIKKYNSLMKINVNNYIKELNFKIYMDKNLINNILNKGKLYIIKKNTELKKIMENSKINNK